MVEVVWCGTGLKKGLEQGLGGCYSGTHQHGTGHRKSPHWPQHGTGLGTEPGIGLRTGLGKPPHQPLTETNLRSGPVKPSHHHGVEQGLELCTGGCPISLSREFSSGGSLVGLWGELSAGGHPFHLWYRRYRRWSSVLGAALVASRKSSALEATMPD